MAFFLLCPLSAQLCVTIKLATGKEFQHTFGPLYTDVIVGECSHTVGKYKVEVKLKKVHISVLHACVRAWTPCQLSSEAVGPLDRLLLSAVRPDPIEVAEALWIVDGGFLSSQRVSRCQCCLCSRLWIRLLVLSILAVPTRHRHLHVCGLMFRAKKSNGKIWSGLMTSLLQAMSPAQRPLPDLPTQAAGPKRSMLCDWLAQFLLRMPEEELGGGLIELGTVI